MKSALSESLLYWKRERVKKEERRREKNGDGRSYQGGEDFCKKVQDENRDKDFDWFELKTAEQKSKKLLKFAVWVKRMKWEETAKSKCWLSSQVWIE